MSLKKYAWHVFNVNTMVQELMLWVDVDYGISKTTSVLLPGSVDRRSAVSVKDFTCALLTVSGGSMSAASPKNLQKLGVLREGLLQHKAEQRPNTRPERPQKFLTLGPLWTKVTAAAHCRSVIWPYGLGCLTLHSC